MSKKHNAIVQKQFARTVEAFSKFAVRDSAEIVAGKIDFIKPQPTDLTLDVACGPGALVLALAPKVRRALGIDLTRAMLCQARAFQRERRIVNAAFHLGEGEHLPYRDSTFDLVSCQYAFHHMPKPEVVLREMLRVLKPGGRLLLDDTLGPEIDSKFELHNRIEILRDASHVASLRFTTFLGMFDRLGLDVITQGLKRRLRSFNQWMLRAGLKRGDRRYQEARRLLEDSITGDRAGFSPQIQGDDIQIVHNEGMFLLGRHAEG